MVERKACLFLPKESPVLWPWPLGWVSADNGLLSHCARRLAPACPPACLPLVHRACHCPFDLAAGKETPWPISPVQPGLPGPAGLLGLPCPCDPRSLFGFLVHKNVLRACPVPGTVPTEGKPSSLQEQGQGFRSQVSPSASCTTAR